MYNFTAFLVIQNVSVAQNLLSNYNTSNVFSKEKIPIYKFSIKM